MVRKKSALVDALLAFRGLGEKDQGLFLQALEQEGNPVFRKCVTRLAKWGEWGSQQTAEQLYRLETERRNRNRKSDPETIRRNVEICDLRQQNKSLWSYTKLAVRFKLASDSIKDIVKEEQKWRALARTARAGGGGN